MLYSESDRSMDQSGFDIAGDLPHREGRSQDLVRVIDAAVPGALVSRARRAIARIGRERFRDSYFTTFWLPRGARSAHPLEELVVALWKLARPRRCAGAEWWIGRALTHRLPIEFHFDHDVKGRRPRHPRLSSVFFFNSVRGGHLAVTDQRPGGREATRLQAVKPRRNRYAIFAGDLFHGVVGANGPVARRVRITLVVNFWERRPTDVPTWWESRAYRALRQKR
jgi:hypothetical protein